MPQALIPVIVKLGVSKLVATIAAYAITTIATSFLSSLLTGGGGSKPEATERDLKLPTPPRLYGMGRRRFFGAQMLFDTASNGTTGDVWAYLDCPSGPIVEVETIYLNDDIATLSGDLVQGQADGRYSGPRVRVGWNMGEATETAFASIVSLFPEVWSNDHRGDRIFSGYLTKDPVLSKDFIKVYPQGDSVTMSLVAKSYRCYDPRDPAQDPHDSATWLWTENAALHLLWFFMVYRALDFDTKLLPVIAKWIDAADVCDEPVALAAGGTEPRYRGCVAWDSSKLPGDVINEMLACFDGWTAEDANGCQLVFAGKVTTPTFSIGPDQIVSSSRQFFVPDEDFNNELVVQYISEAHHWNIVEGQAWRDEADITKRGRINSDGFAPQVSSFPQNRRLAKRRQARQNAPQRGKIATTLSGRDVLSHRYIELLDVEAGATFYSGWAEVVGGERNYETGGAVFDWVAVDPNVDAWNPATEEGSPAPDGARVSQAALTAPVIVEAVAQIDETGNQARILIEATGPDREDLTWFAHWRIAGDVSWGSDLEFPDTDPGTGVTLVTDLVTTGETVEVQVAYQIGDGRVSPWSDTAEVDTNGPVLAELILVDKGGCTISDRTAIKTGNSIGWNSAVRSASSFTGDCVAAGRPAQDDKEVVLGLNSDAPTSGNSYSAIDYGINATGGGTLAIYESGSLVALPGTYAAGDRISVAYDDASGEVKYYRNTTLLHTTSGVGSGLTFYLDASFYDMEARVDGFTFDPD